MATLHNPAERVHHAATTILLADKMGILKTICCNLSKNTHCYKMITINDNDEQSVHFVKIFEDSALSPLYLTTKLWSNTSLRERLSPYLLLPTSKPRALLFNKHKYEIVKYPFIKHVNLQHILLNACCQNIVDPLYHRRNPTGLPHTDAYKMSILQIMSAVISIAIEVKRAGYVDLDMSPDNFVIVKGKCMKIDHESTIKWQSKLNVVRVPIKSQFKAPEVNSAQLAPFDVEKASVYQIGACFIYILHAQLQQDMHWTNGWDPKYLKMRWLARCVDKDPAKRPRYVDIAREIKWELIKNRK